ncbi:GMC family oxidoreductase [Nostoc sp. KVJ3]|uniref:GMC family oxidoreductase n=1 Tax=Nostoc sp. KVJ3 TaxID=457945 RepID=UPI0022371E23|nr:GMC family oxidoreductase N-terminal domain-containing protein [Nostoc sp. KVJ3]MCW5313008.1 GMC family oxidoreductase [Nostoc sp. KVJ3]
MKTNFENEFEHERDNDPGSTSNDDNFTDRVRSNQHKLTSELRHQYDFIVCGSGSSGSVVARRLAENPDVSVLLLEAGGTDDVPSVVTANQWFMNLGSDRDWSFQGQPNPHVNDRSIPFSMGKVLGGGSSINVMVWARGHQRDWDLFAAEVNDPAWGYESVLKIYRRLEDWHGVPDPMYRGTGGPVFVQPAPDPNPIAPATVEGARVVGIPTFENPNGRMMEAAKGASISDVLVRNGKRESIFRSYVFPYMDRPNLTVLSHALVTRLTFQGKRVTGVEISYRDAIYRIGAAVEVVLSLGAIHTPKVLMQSGIGDEAELRRFGIPVVQHLPGVGQNFQDHVAFDCVWEYENALAPRNNLSEAIFFSTSQSGLDSPDLFVCQAEVPKSSAENAVRFGLPDAGWTLFGAIAHPKSRGRLRLTGANPSDPILIDANTLSDADDLKTAIACIELCREVGNSAPLRPFVKREVMPGNLKGAELERFIRDAATSFWHETCTAKMGQDAMSVVDSNLRVYGIDNLRIADGSILPRVTTGNTMAPCVIVGERAAEILHLEHQLQTTVKTDSSVQ